MNNAMQMIIWTNMPFSFSAVSGDILLGDYFARCVIVSTAPDIDGRQELFEPANKT
jgi:hypothetical protein